MNIVGLMPVGGQASRLQPIPSSKALLPVGYRQLPDGTLRPKPVSQYLLEKYRRAGASKAFFMLSQGKWDIPGYYRDGSDPDIDLSLAYLMVKHPYGTPYSLDAAYPFIKDDMCLLGFPDIMIGPDDCFARLVAKQKETGADLVIGIYDVETLKQAQGSDVVEIDENGQVTQIIIKPRETALRLSWEIACWTPVFTEFMHDFLKRDLPQRLTDPGMKELFVGHLVQAAIDAGMHVFSSHFPGHTYLDIGTPDGWAKAYRDYC